jgi:hypothetical protein
MDIKYRLEVAMAALPASALTNGLISLFGSDSLYFRCCTRELTNMLQRTEVAASPRITMDAFPLGPQQES